MPFPNLDGAPVIEFTEKEWGFIDEMMGIHCTGEEIAAIMKVSYDTLERRIKQTHGVSYAEYFKQKSANGKMSLRRRQYTKAMDGDNTQLIWLGKNWLKQTDAVEHSGNVNFNLNYNLDSPPEQDAITDETGVIDSEPDSV
jgi:hypothetical protein